MGLQATKKEEKTTTKSKKPAVKKSRSNARDMSLFRDYAKLRKELREVIGTDDEDAKALLKTLQKKRFALRNTLAENNQPLVTYIVNKYYSARKDHMKYREDLLQEGTIGLLSAIDGFDVERGFKFSTYATWWIRQAVNNYLINIEPMIHVPSHVRTQQNKLIRKLREENKTFQSLIDQGLESTITINDEPISKKMLSSIRSAIQSRYISSLDKPIYTSASQGDRPGTLKEIIPEKKPGLDKIFDQAKLIEIFRDGLKSLTDRERYILLLRFDVISGNDIEAKQTVGHKKL
jgi:RNA polymerase sigma factor (sigma-70 family)